MIIILHYSTHNNDHNSSVTIDSFSAHRFTSLLPSYNYKKVAQPLIVYHKKKLSQILQQCAENHLVSKKFYPKPLIFLTTALLRTSVPTYHIYYVLFKQLQY